MTSRLVAFDAETYLIGKPDVIPKPVCATLAWRDGGVVSRLLVSNGDPHWESVLEATLDGALQDGITIIGQNVAAFDMIVQAIHIPRLASKIWKVFEKGLVRDIMFREMLLNLARHGYVDSYYLPDKTKKDVSYSLDSLARKHLGVDLSAVKGQLEGKGRNATMDTRQDLWRLHHDTLDGVPSAQYPPEAAEYDLADADIALQIAEKQDQVAWEEWGQHGFLGHDGKPFDVFGTEWLHCGAAFALAHMTHIGFGVDQAEVAKMKAAAQRAFRPEHLEILFQAGILSRALPPSPYANGARNPDGTPKMKAGKAQKKNNARLLQIVVATHAEHSRCDEVGCAYFGAECEDHGLLPLRRTEPSKRFPVSEENPDGGQISCDADAVSSLAAFNPVLAAYERWQALGKLLTLEIPVLEGAKTIHGGYDVIKKTCRTSCRGSKNYPSRNIQQLPRYFDVTVLDDAGNPVMTGDKPLTERIEPRRCYVAPYEGWVLISVDYSAIELVSLAQTVFRVIGHSKLRDILNAAKDAHAWLGAQLAQGSSQEFVAHCSRLGLSDRDAYYDAFRAVKHGTKDEQRLYEKYRGLGKIVGLALAGGMGAKKLMETALSTYGVVINGIEEARSYKEIWMDSLPEMREYLGTYIRNNLRDERHSSEDKERFQHFTPLGVLRTCCFFSEVANSFALQAPTGEGAKIAVFEVTRACWDAEMKSVLYGTRPVAFVHDELIVAAPYDHLLHERAFELSRIMIAAMKVLMPDVAVRAEPAVSFAWEKKAEMVLGPDDRIRPWRPDAVYALDANGRLRSSS